MTQVEQTNHAPGETGGTGGDRDTTIARTLVAVGIAGLAAALAFTIVRAVVARRPVDPTSQRIQQLIDEANQLLKTLDDQRNTG